MKDKERQIELVLTVPFIPVCSRYQMLHQILRYEKNQHLMWKKNENSEETDKGKKRRKVCSLSHFPSLRSSNIIHLDIYFPFLPVLSFPFLSSSSFLRLL